MLAAPIMPFIANGILWFNQLCKSVCNHDDDDFCHDYIFFLINMVDIIDCLYY